MRKALYKDKRKVAEIKGESTFYVENRNVFLAGVAMERNSPAHP